jgi:hypothetical protein
MLSFIFLGVLETDFVLTVYISHYDTDFSVIESVKDVASCNETRFYSTYEPNPS